MDTLLMNIEINAEEDLDSEDVHDLTTKLREQLLELGDIETVNFKAAEQVPEHTKDGGAVSLGALIVTLAASGGVFTSLIGMLQAWLTTHERRSVVLEIDGDKVEVKGITSKEQKKLIDVWINRHKRGKKNA